MRRPCYIVALLTDKNDYQLAQMECARETGRRLDVDVEVLFAENDAVEQTQQLLQVIGRKSRKPEGIICCSVGSDLPQVAATAASAGIGWAILNWEGEHLRDLWELYHVPVCSVRPDHAAIGEIQGRQVEALLPHGGKLLCVLGPSSSSVTGKRLAGMQSVLRPGIELRTVHGLWTQESAYHTVAERLRIMAEQSVDFDLVVCQNDDMAVGARKAFLENGAKWEHLRYTGIDGLPEGGQALVRQGVLAATVVVPVTSGIALEQLVESRRTGVHPPFELLVAPGSFPGVEALAPVA